VDAAGRVVALEDGEVCFATVGTCLSGQVDPTGGWRGRMERVFAKFNGE
jgi:hypothetical protein